MDGGAMTRRNPREWTKPIYCGECHRSIMVRVEMLLPIPEREPGRAKWIDRAVSEAEAKFEREHAATCGRTK